MRCLPLVVVISFPAFASNCTNAGTCPAGCTGTVGSTTFAAIADTAYTSPAGTTIASTDCVNSVPYDTFGSYPNCTNATVNYYCMNAFMPHGFDPATLFWILCWHGGGGNSGYWTNCLGPGVSGTTTYPIQLIQQYLDAPNPVGGKGIGIVELEYCWSTVAGCEFPAQARAVSCGISWVMAGNLGFIPTTLGYYGPSWGGALAFWAGNVPASVYGASPTCLSPDARPGVLTHGQRVGSHGLDAAGWLEPLGKRSV